MKLLSRRRAARSGALAVLAALPLSLLPLSEAHAADRTVRGGRLDWGVRSSFQSYVTGPVAQGSWSLLGGAATVGGSQFRFHSATGTYDPDSGTLRAGFSGGVRFVGHKKANGVAELDLTVSRPTVRVSGGAGTLYADMSSKAKGSGRVTTRGQVPLASLDLSGIDTRGGGATIGLATVPATLTAQGASAFAGYYAAGTALDPVTLSVDVLAPAGAAKSPSPQTGPDGRKSGRDEEGKGAKDSEDREGGEDGKGGKGEADKKTAAEAVRFEDAAVDWGVRRTFREYVTGAIAKGKWKLSGGAQDGGALFRFPKGEGRYDAGAGTLEADFAGRVRFTGEAGLDLSLSAVHVDVEKGTGTLSARVQAPDLPPGLDGRVPLVTFDAGGLTPGKGRAARLVTVTEAPAKLTARGAKAFGGMYRAGTAMDPVSLAVALDDKAELPALPDLGSGADASPAAAPETSGEPTPAATSASAASSAALPVGIGLGAAALLCAATGYALVRRRRIATARDTPAADTPVADGSTRG